MFSLETLKAYEDKGLIKSSARDGFTVWCYTQRCVIDRAWDEVTRACRGLVLDSVGNLVSRPFPKFHNYGEPEAQIERGPFIAFDKMDGTLIIVGNYNDEAVVSTKGSFDTWHSEAARDLLKGFVPPEGATAIFELIHPANRIVVDYGDYEGLVFLGGVNNETGADIGMPAETATAWGWHGDSVVQRNFPLQAMINTVQTPDAGQNREGFVVVWPDETGPSNRIKLKFELYVKMHAIYTGLTNRKVWECLMDDSLSDLLDVAPDELHADIKEVADEIHEEAAAVYREAYEAKEAAVERYGDDRKHIAAYFNHNLEKPRGSIGFKILDGKTEEAAKLALKMCRPEESRFVGSTGLS